MWNHVIVCGEDILNEINKKTNMAMKHHFLKLHVINKGNNIKSIFGTLQSHFQIQKLYGEGLHHRDCAKQATA